MLEGIGWKQILFSVCFQDPVKRVAFQDMLNKQDLKKLYRVRGIAMNGDSIAVAFFSDRDIKQRMEVFLDWFIPEMEAAGVQGQNICPDCGEPITDGCWAQTTDFIRHLHKDCAEKRKAEIDAHNASLEGSHGKGFLGAVLGALLGAVVVALAGMDFAILPALAAFLTGLLAFKGYDLLHGKCDRKKLGLTIGAAVIGGILGRILILVRIYMEWLWTEGIQLTDEYWQEYLYYIRLDWEYWAYMGLLYILMSALGAWYLWRMKGGRGDERVFAYLE